MRWNWLLYLTICVNTVSSRELEEVLSLSFDPGWSPVQAQVREGGSGGLRNSKQLAKKLASQFQWIREESKAIRDGQVSITPDCGRISFGVYRQKEIKFFF
jgi:hypothetical protein